METVMKTSEAIGAGALASEAGFGANNMMSVDFKVKC
jgi:hypothetical protein